MDLLSEIDALEDDRGDIYAPAYGKVSRVAERFAERIEALREREGDSRRVTARKQRLGEMVEPLDRAKLPLPSVVARVLGRSDGRRTFDTDTALSSRPVVRRSDLFSSKFGGDVDDVDDLDLQFDDEHTDGVDEAIASAVGDVLADVGIARTYGAVPPGRVGVRADDAYASDVLDEDDPWLDDDLFVESL